MSRGSEESNTEPEEPYSLNLRGSVYALICDMSDMNIMGSDSGLSKGVFF